VRARQTCTDSSVCQRFSGGAISSILSLLRPHRRCSALGVLQIQAAVTPGFGLGCLSEAPVTQDQARTL
jgi:hypothetical protein